MDPKQLLVYIIRPALEDLGGKYSGSAAEQLLLATAAQETHAGEDVHQIGGPALGIYQMEGTTLRDLYANYLDYHPGVRGLVGERSATRLMYDARYATQCARLEYYRQPEALPNAGDIPAMFRYYKKYWNSAAGAATSTQFADNWKRYVVAAL